MAPGLPPGSYLLTVARGPSSTDFGSFNVTISAVGLQGQKGDKGDTGAKGAQGLKGDTGDTGAQGLKGDTGDTGAQGPKGDTGDTGAQGPKGDTGDTGAQGLKGDTGDTGAQGPQSDTGDTGAQGLKGDTGDTGAQGLKGDTGDTGAQGPKGDTGDTGAQGIQGPIGPTGETGDQGIQGPAGPSALTLCTGNETLLADGSCVAIPPALQALIDDLQAEIDTLNGPRTVFVTSGTFNGNLGGIAGADAKCQAAANSSSSIVPPGSYLAWLSGTSFSPALRFTHSIQRYVLPGADEFTVANNYTDLTDGALLHAINIDETGSGVSPAGTPGTTWTATDADGTKVPFLSGNRCDDNSVDGNVWTNSAALAQNVANQAIVGLTSSTSAGWSNIAVQTCDAPRRLYCFQQ